MRSGLVPGKLRATSCAARVSAVTNSGAPNCVSSSGRARTKPAPDLGSAAAPSNTPSLAYPKLVAPRGSGARPQPALKPSRPRPVSAVRSAHIPGLTDRRLDLALGTRTLRTIMGSRGPMDQFTAHLDRGWDLVNRG